MRLMSACSSLLKPLAPGVSREENRQDHQSGQLLHPKGRQHRRAGKEGRHARLGRCGIWPPDAQPIGEERAYLYEFLSMAKRYGLADGVLAQLAGISEGEFRALRKELGIIPVYKKVDTCAGEFRAATPYYYSTYEQEDEAEVSTGPR